VGVGGTERSSVRRIIRVAASVSIGSDLPRCRRVRRSGWTGLHHGEVLIQQVARSGRRRSGRWLPSRPCPAARAGSASPAAASTAALAVSRELLVAEQPSLLVETAGWWVRPWVSTAPMTTWCAWACWGVAVALGHEPGQAPAGRDGHTSDRAWRPGSYQVTGARPFAWRFTRPCRAGQQLPG
jgi:hypothetical protein